MPTTVVSSIGNTGRDYSTIQAWEDDIPADLTAADEVWIGECYNDGEIVGGVTITGHTTDATRYIRLTAAAGHSFQDHAGARSNPLFYDATKGVGITNSSAVQALISVGNLYTHVDRLQIKLSVRAAYIGNRCIELPYASAGRNLLKDCICYQSTTNTGSPGLPVSVGSATAVNVLAVQCATNSHGFSFNDNARLYNCTAIAIGSNSGAGYYGSYADGSNLKTCAAFNFSSFNSGGASSASYCGSNLATVPGSNTQTSLTFSDCFESTTNDFRLKAGSPLIGTGNTSASYPNDITGTARDSGTAGDIGAWEYTAGGGGGTDIPEHLLRMRRPGVVWSNNTGA